MKVNVRYFAAASVAAGTDSESIDIAEDATVENLIAAIMAARADSVRLARVLDISSFLVNGRRAERSMVLTGSPDVDVLPPFAGGGC